MTGEIYGQSADEALKRVGALRQLASCEEYTVSNGPEAGSRRIRISAGDIDLELLPDRGLDVGAARVAGVPVAWVSPTGFPVRSVTDDGAFTRTFGAGLVTTCGLQNYGPASVDGDEAHPMHGRYTAQPATIVRAEATIDEVTVEAIIRETDAFGVHLELRRTVTVLVAEQRISIHDEIANRGATATDCMVLYHVNFGWPLVDAGTELRTGADQVEPRDSEAAKDQDSWNRFPELADSYPEQVFVHSLPEASQADIEVVHASGFTAHVRYDTRQLPGLFEWRVSRPGCVVLGVEPASAQTISGRADARERGLLREVAPGEKIEFALEIGFSGQFN
ncbi:MAG: aldose 1-epimerase family protein [Leucobacter sp.]